MCLIHPINLSLHTVIAAKAVYNCDNFYMSFGSLLPVPSVNYVSTLKVLAIIYGDAAKKSNNTLSRVHVSACFIYSTMHTKLTVANSH
jgi:hypothetical protein